MDLNDLSKEYQAIFRHYLSGAVKHPEAFHSKIHENDEMFHKAIVPGYPNRNISFFKYMESGKRMMDVVRQITDHAFSGIDRIASFLEFACGYGRFTRFLLQEMPPERIWTSDIYAEAVRWQQDYFHVNGFVSHTDPDKCMHQNKHDLVFVGSLFSHLPPSLFTAWLGKLYALVDEGGILAFSVHDMDIVPSGDDMSATEEATGREGIRYFKMSESDSLSKDTYGLTYVTQQYVNEVIREVVGSNGSSFARFPGALYEFQDLYIISRNSAVDLGALKLRISPLGGIEDARIDGEGRLVVKGWGIDLNQGSQLISAELLCNDASIDSTKPRPDRTDVLRYFPKAPNTPVSWTLHGPEQDLYSDDLIMCVARSSTGTECQYYVPFSDCRTTFAE